MSQAPQPQRLDSSSSWTDAGPAGIGMSLSAEEKLRLVSALTQLLESGLPYSETMKEVTTGLPDPKFRRLVMEFAARVDAGQNLEQAMEPLLESADAKMKGIARTVMRTRDPMKTFLSVVEYRRRRSEITRFFWLRLLYPIILFLFTAVIFGIVMQIVLKSVAPVFRDFGANLPQITIIFLKAAEWLDKLGPSGILVPGLLGVGILVLIVNWFNTVLHKWHDLAFFCRTLAELERSSNPLPESLAMCASIFSGRLSAALNDMADQVRSGESLATAIDTYYALPDGLASMIEWSESAGKGNAEGLDVAASIFEARGKGTSTILSTLFTVFTVITVVWLIQIIVAAVYLPLTSFLRLLA